MRATYRPLPYLAIIIFIIAKIPHLHYGFYWDESWVYGPAIYAMYAHGPSLSPAAIAVNLSRGHPLLYHAGCAAWMRLFGPSIFSVHCYALLLSTALAVAVYEYMRKLFNPETALLALVLLLCNDDFFYSSSMLLTDIPLGLFVFMGISAYSRKRYIGSTAAFTAMLYIKESGLVLLPVISVDILIAFINERYSLRELLRRLLVIVVPSAAILLFFIVQKMVNGWYLNPGHISMIDTGIISTAGFAQRSMKMVLVSGNEYLYFMLAGILGIVVAIQAKKYTCLWALTAGGMLFLAVLVFSFKDAIFFPLVFVPVIIVLWLLKKNSGFNSEQKRFVRVALLFCAAYLYFCCINFFEERYLFPALMLIDVCLLAVYIERVVNALPWRKQVYAGTLICCCAVGLYNVVNADEYKHQYTAMALQQDVVDYFERMRNYDIPVCAHEFFEYIHLADPGTGFLRHNRSFTHVTGDVDSSTRYVIISSDEYYEGWLAKLQDSFYKVQTFEHNRESIIVLKRR